MEILKYIAVFYVGGMFGAAAQIFPYALMGGALFRFIGTSMLWPYHLLKWVLVLFGLT